MSPLFAHLITHSNLKTGRKSERYCLVDFTSRVDNKEREITRSPDLSGRLYDTDS